MLRVSKESLGSAMQVVLIDAHRSVEAETVLRLLLDPDRSMRSSSKVS